MKPDYATKTPRHKVYYYIIGARFVSLLFSGLNKFFSAIQICNFSEVLGNSITNSRNFKFSNYFSA